VWSSCVAQPDACRHASCSNFRARRPRGTRGRRARRLPNRAIDKNHLEPAMLKWALIFAIIAIVAGIFGFTGIAAGAATIAKFLCFVFVALLVLTLIFGASLFK
jgi:uncharacterized membrane protein YtjA (UPF0391 family)